MKRQLVWVTFGSGWGTAREDDRFVWGWKWRDQGRKWTNPVRLSKALVKGPVGREEMETAKVKRALAELKDQLSIVRNR